MSTPDDPRRPVTCGCAFTINNGSNWIQCPLHAAAAEMAVMLRSVLCAAENKNHAWLVDIAPDIIRVLLAQIPEMNSGSREETR